MAPAHALIVACARSAVAPHGGAFAHLQSHELGAPVLQGLLARAGVRPTDVHAVVLGNALGAGGNPARMLSLAAELPDTCAGMSVDTQCCSGMDAISVGVGLIASGQFDVVAAGGVEAWSRAPIRQHRPMSKGELPTTYERPAFVPDPSRDPDLLQAAADYAARYCVSRERQDAYALESHARALAAQHDLRDEIVAVEGVRDDLYPRNMTPARAARIPLVRGQSQLGVSALAISPRADAAALLLLASSTACRRLGLRPIAAWRVGVAVASDPREPLVAAEHAAREALSRAGLVHASRLKTIELHDAFAVQGLSFRQGLGVESTLVNRRGGGLARGHPIGASAAVALVRLISDLTRDGRPGTLGLAAVAGAGGVGSAAMVECL